MFLLTQQTIAFISQALKDIAWAIGTSSEEGASFQSTLEWADFNSAGELLNCTMI